MNRYTAFLFPDIQSASNTWDAPEWNRAETISVSHFLQESSSHRPAVLVKMLCSGAAAHAFFKVSDRYVRCTRTAYGSDVWNDSCVEWFVQPKADKGYFNFEINCGGALHVSYIEDPKRLPDGSRAKSVPVPAKLGESVEIFHSMPRIVDPEISAPMEWLVKVSVPYAVFEAFIGPVGDLERQEWRANFNKCADQTSHPHWATWNPISEKNFHRPWEFGAIRFERRLFH